MPPVTPEKYTTVLTIAGSDSSGGAGIQADLKTFAALECYGLSVITCITAQNTRGVQHTFPLPAAQVKSQIESLASDIEIDAVKIGMLSSKEIIRAIAAVLQNYRTVPVILDTVIRSSSGAELLAPSAKEEIIQELFPLATLVTPNIPEAAELAGLEALPASIAETEDAAGCLIEQGAHAVLIKGGHTAGNRCADYLLSGKKGEWFSTPRIITRNTHGTGCTLSAAIASYSAKGLPLREAVKKGRDFTVKALKAGSRFKLGTGHGPLHHLYRWW